MVGIKGFPAVIVSTKLSSLDRRTNIERLFKRISKPSPLRQFRKGDFNGLLRESTLEKDSESLYLYQIEYDFPAKYGSHAWIKRTLRTVVALSRIGDLRAHEGESKEDTEKMKASFKKTGILLTPIMAMVDDTANIIKELYDILQPSGQETKSTVLIYREEFRDRTPEPRGSTHTIWQIKDPKWIEWFKVRVLKKKYAIITDGHHRYRALKELGYSWIPTVFVDINDDDLVLMSWHRLVKGMDRKAIREAIRQVSGNEFSKEYGTMRFKVGTLKDVRDALHPEPSMKLKVKRRLLPELAMEEDFRNGAVRLSGRPFVGEDMEFPESEIFSKEGKKGIYWEGTFIGQTKKFVMFGAYLIDKKGIFFTTKEEKFNLLTSTRNIASFTTAIDNLIKRFVGREELEERIAFSPEIGEARNLVYDEKFSLAILVPVLRKRDILRYIATGRAERELPAKLTCFLPKPAGALLMCYLNDLKGE